MCVGVRARARACVCVRVCVSNAGVRKSRQFDKPLRMSGIVCRAQHHVSHFIEQLLPPRIFVRAVFQRRLTQRVRSSLARSPHDLGGVQ